MRKNAATLRRSSRVHRVAFSSGLFLRYFYNAIVNNFCLRPGIFPSGIYELDNNGVNVLVIPRDRTTCGEKSVCLTTLRVIA